MSNVNPGVPSAPASAEQHEDFVLKDGSRVAVLGGGPAGSMFACFLLDLAQRIGVDIKVDIFEARDFTKPGPAGCNMCGGIISESLVQMLAAEGINLPPTVVKRGIESYMLHMDVGDVRIDTPLQEMRIAAVHRGAGPRDIKHSKWMSFDKYLLDLAIEKGACLVASRVEEVTLQEGYPQIKARGGEIQKYELLTVAVGVNTGILKTFEDLAVGYHAPGTTRTYIAEFFLGEDVVEKHLGGSMHVFLLNLPRLEFAAIIPKGDYVTMCMLGEDIDDKLVESFMESEEVGRCFPPGWKRPDTHCHCSPKMNIIPAQQPFADRLVFIGDAGVSRLYKDGMGASYRTAKAAAVTAIFEGVSAADFRRYYEPACGLIRTDNKFGGLVFMVTRLIQKLRVARTGVSRMVNREQRRGGAVRPMSMVLWDTFTGSAPYRDIFFRAATPQFLGRLLWETAAGLVSTNSRKK